MTTFDSNWQRFLSYDFADDIPHEIFQYRSREIDAILSWRSAHEIAKPAILEIGFNRGRFLVGLAQARRDRCVVGIEMKPSLTRITAKKLERRGLAHAHVLNADAMLAMPMLFGQASLEAIYLLFPDPWWKKRHERRRLFSDELLAFASRMLLDGGHLILRTDVKAYYDRSIEAIASHPVFEAVHRSEVPYSDHWVHTTRERHCVRDGLAVYELCLRRRQR